MSDSPPAPARICPECGRDPRARVPRPPWWCSRLGLPLWAALLVLLGEVTCAALSPGAATVITGAGKFSLGIGEPLGEVTFGDLAAAAAGDEALAGRVAHAVRAQLADPWTASSATPEVAIATPLLPELTVCEFGRPYAWLVIERGLRQSGSVTYMINPAPAGFVDPIMYLWRWRDGEVGVSRFGGKSVPLELVLRPGLLAILLAAAALAFCAARACLFRFRSRVVRRASVLVVAAAALLAIGAPRTRTVPSTTTIWRAEQPTITAAEARAMAGARGRRVELARALGGGRYLAEDSAVVFLSWSDSHPSTAEVRTWGWPAKSIVVQTYVPGSPPAGTPDRTQRRLVNHSGHLGWITSRPNGTERLVALNLNGLGFSLLLPMAAYLAPVLTGSLWQRRRAGRLRKAGCCLSCGYEVGLV